MSDTGTLRSHRWLSRVDSALVVAMVTSFPLVGFVPLSIRSVGIKFSWLVGLAIVVTGSVRAVRRGTIRWSPGLLLIGLWIGWATMTGFRPLSSGDPVRIRELFFGVLRLSAFFALVLGLYNLNVRHKTIRTFFRATAVVAVLVSLYAIYQFFAREYQLPFAYLRLANPSLLADRQMGGTYYTGGVFYRTSSLFSEPSHLGMYLADVIFIVALPLLYSVSENVLFDSRRMNIGVLSVVTVAFMIAYSLGAYVALFFAAVIVVAVDWSNVRDRLASVFAVTSTIYFLFDLAVAGGRITVVMLKRIFGLSSRIFGPYLRWVPVPSGTIPEIPNVAFPSLIDILISLWSRLSKLLESSGSSESGASGSGGSSGSGSSSGTGGSSGSADQGSEAVETVTRSSLDVRADRIQSGLDVWLEQPLTGVGLNNYQFHVERGVEFVGRTYGWTFNYFKMLAELGIVGLLLFTLLLGYVVREFHQIANSLLETGDETSAAIARTFFSLVVFGAVSAMFVNQFYSIRVWFYIGMGLTAVSTVAPTTVRTVSIPHLSRLNRELAQIWN